MLNLFVDPSIPAEAPFEQVRAQAFDLLEPERFAQVSAYLRDVEFDKAVNGPTTRPCRRTSSGICATCSSPCSSPAGSRTLH